MISPGTKWNRSKILLSKMPAEAFLPDRVNLVGGMCTFKGQLLSERLFAQRRLLSPAARAGVCVSVCVCGGGGNHRIYQTSRLFWASYLVLIDEEEHDEQNLQEEDKQEQDEELRDTKGGKFNTAFI